MLIGSSEINFLTAHQLKNIIHCQQ